MGGPAVQAPPGGLPRCGAWYFFGDREAGEAREPESIRGFAFWINGLVLMRGEPPRVRACPPPTEVHAHAQDTSNGSRSAARLCRRRHAAARRRHARAAQSAAGLGDAGGIARRRHSPGPAHRHGHANLGQGVRWQWPHVRELPHRRRSDGLRRATGGPDRRFSGVPCTSRRRGIAGRAHQRLLRPLDERPDASAREPGNGRAARLHRVAVAGCADRRRSRGPRLQRHRHARQAGPDARQGAVRSEMRGVPWRDGSGHARRAECARLPPAMGTQIVQHRRRHGARIGGGRVRAGQDAARQCGHPHRPGCLRYRRVLHHPAAAALRGRRT